MNVSFVKQGSDQRQAGCEHVDRGRDGSHHHHGPPRFTDSGILRHSRFVT